MGSSEFAETCSKPDDVRLFSVTLPRPIAFTYLLSILYNITFFMQFMATPYFLKSLGVSDTENGYIQTLFGILQMCGAPLFGTIVQKFGIRFALHLCYGSTMISGILLYLSYDVKTLMISRIPCLFMHGQQGHQTLLSALTDPGKERTNAFGRMGLTFGLGFIFTPIFSFISTSFFSVSGPILVSAVLCIVPSLVLENCIERSSYENCRSEECEKPLQSMNVSNVVRILNKPGVLNVMFKKNAPILPMLLVFAIMQLYLVERFQADVNTGQAIQMMTGVCIMFSNGFGVIWMRKKFSEQTLLFIGMIFFVSPCFFFIPEDFVHSHQTDAFACRRTRLSKQSFSVGHGTFSDRACIVLTHYIEPCVLPAHTARSFEVSRGAKRLHQLLDGIWICQAQRSCAWKMSFSVPHIFMVYLLNKG
ncbi:MFS domain-containing protein, partial [Trichostrongylus colubriformis]